MVKRSASFILAVLLFCSLHTGAQEILLPLQSSAVIPMPKDATDGRVDLPFFDDFSRPTNSPQSSLWEPCGATVGIGYGELAPTVGMATLDAIDATGNLYTQASTSPFPADTLLSRAIRLNSISPADSLVLSFFYLPGGGYGNLWERVGDTPDAADSIYLDLFRAADSSWHTVWSRNGVCVDTLIAHTGHAWQYVAVAITDSGYFDSTFRFRFRNHASLDATSKKGMKGNCDQWNIDYLLLDTMRSSSNEHHWRDVAFAAPAPSMLANYLAMPARQYRASEMAQNLNLQITNLYNSDLATQYAYFIIDESGDTLHHYDGGFENAPYDGYQTAAAHAQPPVNYAFPEGNNHREYEIIHTIREGVGGDSHQQNDTIRLRQVLADYFAYDDGTAENGYGLTSTAARVYLAYRFDLNEADTLSAVDLYFNRTFGNENEAIGFYLTIWQADNNGRPSDVLYRDEERRHPQFDNLNTYQRYSLEHPIVTNGSIFVGFEQVGNDFINLGFDRNNQSAERIWYLTSTEWQQSILRGSLMLRPVFGTAAVNGISDLQASYPKPIVFPNPADDYFNIPIEGCSIALYNRLGCKVWTGNGNRVVTSDIPSGLYLVRLITPDGILHTCKLIIKH